MQSAKGRPARCAAFGSLLAAALALGCNTFGMGTPEEATRDGAAVAGDVPAAGAPPEQAAAPAVSAGTTSGPAVSAGTAAPAVSAGTAAPAPLLAVPAVSARGLWKRFGSKTAVAGVNLVVPAGSFYGLVGPNGAGKTTTLSMMTGLLRPDAGTVEIAGSDVWRDPVAVKAMIGVLPEGLRLFERLSGRELLGYLGRLRRMPRAEVDSYSRELLGLVGLTDDALHAYPRQFSGGQRQRVAIARALALRPELLVADEPVSALDVSVQATILNLLQELRGSLGLTLLLISHNLAVVRHLCDRTAVMYLGRIIEVAPTSELFAAPRHPYTRGLLAAIPRMTALADNEAPAVQGDPPSPLRIPAGCRFRTRCPIAQERCAHDDPELTAAPGRPAHVAACHFPLDAPARNVVGRNVVGLSTVQGEPSPSQ